MFVTGMINPVPLVPDGRTTESAQWFKWPRRSDEELYLNTGESRLRLWNGAALAFVALLAGMPSELLPRTPPETPAGYVFVTIGAITLGGFWLRMIIECAISKDIRARGAWLALVLLVPFFGAFIFFASARSIRCEKTRDSANTEAI